MLIRISMVTLSPIQIEYTHGERITMIIMQPMMPIIISLSFCCVTYPLHVASFIGIGSGIPKRHAYDSEYYQHDTEVAIGNLIGVTNVGVNSLDIRRFDVINSMTLEICIIKNCTPMLITALASLKLMSLKDGRRCGYL